MRNKDGTQTLPRNVTFDKLILATPISKSIDNVIEEEDSVRRSISTPSNMNDADIQNITNKSNVSTANDST